MSAHAKLSPSAAERWLNCTAAPTMEKDYPAETTSYAAEGTFAHKLAELSARYATGLCTKRTYTSNLKKLQADELYSVEMFDHCDEYGQYVHAQLLRAQEVCPDAFCELEVRLDLTDLIPGGFGTADAVIIAEPVMYVIDFKYGKGVKVEADSNAQMMLYAYGAIRKYEALYDITDIAMTIVQPRLGGSSTAIVDAEELKGWAENTVRPKAEEAHSGPGTFAPSESVCRFCRAREDCRARAKYYIDMFEDAPETEKLTADEAGDLLRRAAGIEDWVTGLKEKVFGALTAGEAVEGWKLVEGKSNRRYTDENEVASILEAESDLGFDQLYTTKLITITAVEKLLGKKRTAELIGEYIEKPKGKPVIAPVTDKRPEIHPGEDIINAFDEE